MNIEAEIEPVSSPEEKTDLEGQVRLGRALEDLIKMEGWHQVLAPWLCAMQKNFEQGILNATELKEFVSAQQKINLIDGIFDFVKNGIEIGKGASLRLSEDVGNDKEGNTENS